MALFLPMIFGEANSWPEIDASREARANFPITQSATDNIVPPQNGHCSNLRSRRSIECKRRTHVPRPVPGHLSQSKKFKDKGTDNDEGLGSSLPRQDACTSTCREEHDERLRQYHVSDLRIG